MFVGMPGVEISPIEVGSEGGGYRISGSPGTVLRIRAWGYWPLDVATTFSREVGGVCRDLAPEATLALDASDFKPQGAEGQEALRVFLRALAPLAFAKGLVLAGNALTRMQLTRLVRECGLDGRMTFSDSFK
jgi:hypothetical protein